MEERKITRQELKEMDMGETRHFYLSDYANVCSGKNTAYEYAKFLGCSFRCNVTKVEYGSSEESSQGWCLTVTKENLKS